MIQPDYNIRVPAELGGGAISRPLLEPVLSKTTYQPATAVKMTAMASTMTKKVRVLDDQGTPLPGAHVYFDQNNGNSTNFNGEATVSSIDPNKTVYISYVGFQPKAFKLKDLPSSVSLLPGETLKEVVITAPAKAAATDSKVPKYLFPAIGGVALLLILMSMGSPAPKEVTL